MSLTGHHSLRFFYELAQVRSSSDTCEQDEQVPEKLDRRMQQQQQHSGFFSFELIHSSARKKENCLFFCFFEVGFLKEKKILTSFCFGQSLQKLFKASVLN